MIKLLLLTSFVSVLSNDHNYFLSDEFINSINRQQTNWVAGRNFPKDAPSNILETLACAIFEDEEAMKHIPQASFESHELNVPESFNALEKWPECKSIEEIRDQGQCGSCWAISVVQVMTDRYCIHYKIDHHFATLDPLTCCQGCGSCNGGIPRMAFEFWIEKGIVSGGNLNTKEGCRPYYVDPNQTPPCEEKCHANYNISYKDDKKFGSNVYRLLGEEQIKADLYKNGPLVVGFDVYEDFSNYKNGVYKYVEGQYRGGHAVKVVGWGVEKGQKYWLIANSWGSDWGDNGYFKIVRGINECRIESSTVVACH